MPATKTRPWLKVWTGMPSDIKIRQLDVIEKWIWTALLCMCQRSLKQPEVWTQKIDLRGRPDPDSDWKPATIIDLSRVVAIDPEFWLQKHELKFNSTYREHYTKMEFLAFLAVEHFKALGMVTESDRGTLSVVKFTKRQFLDVDEVEPVEATPTPTEAPLGPSPTPPPCIPLSCCVTPGTEHKLGEEEGGSGGKKENPPKVQKTKRGPGSGKPRTEKGLAIYEVFDHWVKVMEKPKALLGKDRKKAIEARLNEGYSVEDLKKAIDGCRSSAFHMGENERSTVYNDLELICRNGRKVEQFIARLQRHGGIRYVGGKPSNRYLGQDQGAPADDPEARRRLEELRELGRDEVPAVRKDAEGGLPPAGPAETQGA